MDWAKPRTTVYGFWTADALLVTDGYLLARWNHTDCRGWQLYTVVERRRHEYTGVRWVVGAGAESLDWSDEQAARWAEGAIADAAN